jgi:CubicO group peptidase (beta-lactamase class C family)
MTLLRAIHRNLGVGSMQHALWALSLVCFAGCSVNIDAEVDRLFVDYRADGMPGASVMVIKNGEAVLTKSYGLAHVDQRKPVTPLTNFRLASVTKQFTATAVLMLVDQGQLGLDDSLRAHFPEMPAFAAEITVRHMLQHTSGIEDYEPIFGDRFPEQITDGGVVDIIRGTRGTYFNPGSEHRYSNSAYAILAVLVERLSGNSFAQFLDQHIFAPLGMTNTVAYEAGNSAVANRAYGYAVSENEVNFADQSAWSAVLGDGGVYSSVTDLYRWDQALYSDELLPATLWAEAFTPGLEDYGFGWRIDRYRDRERYHHSGSTSGFRNFMQKFPEERLTVIVLSNRAEPDVQPLAEKIADLYL